MPREIIERKGIRNDIANEKFENIEFQRLLIFTKKVSNCIFENCHFKNSVLSSTFENCKFVKCKFDGQYASFGKASVYDSCEFANCNIKGQWTLDGELFKFKNCSISGKISGSILNDTKDGSVRFSNCDLSNLIFENVCFYGKRLFEKCTMPHKNLRLFKNDNNVLFVRAAKQMKKSNPKSISKCETFFTLGLTKELERLKYEPSDFNDPVNEDVVSNVLKFGQNPILIDSKSYFSFFDEESRNLFEKIVEGFEINIAMANTVIKNKATNE